MKKLITFFFSFFSIIILFAQNDKKMSENNQLLIRPIYDNEFNSLSKHPAKKIAKQLFKKELNTLIFDSIISRSNMMGLALPLGVHNSQNDSINLIKGMCDMWQQKVKFAQKKNKLLPNDIALTSYHFINQVLLSQTKDSVVNIRTYRKEVIEKSINETKQIYVNRLANSPSNSEKRKFMNMFMDVLSPNILLAYNIQEILPPKHMIDNKLYDINPLFKVYYFDQLLQNGSYAFLEGFPARYDTLLSFGPFQMTDISLKGIAENTRVFDEFKVYKNMKDLINIHDHAKAATYFAYCNWDYLASSLDEENLLKPFNEYFQDYQRDEEKLRKLRILVAGLTACMHHSSAVTRRMLRESVEAKNFENIHYQILETASANKQLKKYYKSSAEAYLILKVYQELKDDYVK